MLDVTVPEDKNISLKEFQKLSKYKDLEAEVTKMRKLKTKTIPVVIGVLGMIKKSTQNFIDRIPGKASLQEMQKILLRVDTHKYCSHTTKSTLNVNTLTSLKLIRVINKLPKNNSKYYMGHESFTEKFHISYLLKDIYLFLFTIIY